MLENKEKQSLLTNENIMEDLETFGEKKINKNFSLLNSKIIKKEVKRQEREISKFSTNEEDKIFTDNIYKLILIIIFISSFFFFKQKLINLKRHYLSDKTLFYYNIFYSEPKNNFLIFIILICCFTISSGFKLLLLQMASYILCLLIIIIKNKIINVKNIFDKNLVIFHCCDIIICFLYLGEKLIQIYKDNNYHILIHIIILFFNYNAMIYFILVEIINCKYDDIIIEIFWGLLIIISFYFSMFYIMKLKIWPKKIISFLIRNIFLTFIICIIILVFSFSIILYNNILEYFFANKLLMKFIGILAYLIFELYFIFKDKEDQKLKYFNLYNIYSNGYLYSKTTKLKKILRVSIILLFEHFLIYRLDISYKTNMPILTCVLIISLDIFHGFIVMFIMKYLFNLINLNNTDLLDIDTSNPFMRYGSISDNRGEVPLIFE